jgi:hypothetical protein
MSTDGKQKSQLVEIGALWYSTKTPGVMTGKLGNARLVLLPNDRKEGAQPDCRIFVAPFEKRDQPQQQQPQQQRGGGEDLPW